MQHSELLDSFWIIFHALEAGLEQSNEDAEEESQRCGSNYDEAAPRGGSSVRRNCGIDNLNERALLCLVELGDLELPRQDIEYRLVILHVAQLADVFEAGLRHLALGDHESAIGAVFRASQ